MKNIKYILLSVIAILSIGTVGMTSANAESNADDDTQKLVDNSSSADVKETKESTSSTESSSTESSSTEPSSTENSSSTSSSEQGLTSTTTPDIKETPTSESQTTATPTTTNEKLPQTGDNSSKTALAIMSVGILGFLGSFLFKKFN